MSTAAPTISFSGLASGLDTSSIITQLTTTAQLPITQLNTQITGYNSQITDWQTLNTNLASLQTAVTALSNLSTVSVPSGSSTNTAAATITTQVGAAIGNHTLTVNQLAQAQEVVSTTQSSSTTALGQTGSFTINGKTVQINTSDALADVASKINAVSAGVTANVVNVGTNDYRLTLTSTATGAVNAIAAADTSGTVLGSLGVVGTGAAGIRQSISYTQGTTAYKGAASLTLGSAMTPIGSQLGITAGSAQSGTFHLSNGATGTGNEADIAINLNTDSLSDVANAINKAGISGVSAEVVTVPDSNGNLDRIHQLRIVSTGSAAPTFTDTSGALSTVGILQQSYTKTVTAAQDAKFNLDGLDLTRSTNTVNDAITGATVSLLSGSSTTPATTTLSVAQNTNSIVSAVTAFVTAYNAVQDFVTNENKFTAPNSSASGDAGSSPALFGSTTLTQIQQTLSQALTAVSGKNTLSSIGITLNTSNDLAVDSTTLTTALQADPNAVSNLFGLSGTSDSSSIQFIKGSAKSAASSSTGYAVVITQPATQTTGTAGTASAVGAVSAAPETLTFGGDLFSPSNDLTIPAGSTVQQTAALINATSSLNTQIYASVDSSNHLVIASQGYGSGTGFSVTSSLAASTTNSGIGASLTVTAGEDVAGTINGEAATGTGRTLIGNTGDLHAEGVQLLVTATAASTVGSPTGHVTVTHGVADGLSVALTQVLDPTNGSVAGAESVLNSQITSSNTQIVQIQTTVDTYKAYLTEMFSEMETRVSALQAQGNAFTAAFASTTSSSSTSSSAGTASASS
ncbi:MAG: flagellar filament capping protein FliD [Janthinobacterium lividum]